MADSDFFLEIVLPRLAEGTLVTIELVLLSALPQLLLGVLIAVARVYGNKLISGLSLAYVVFFRGTPLVVLLFILYYGLPSIGLYLSPTVAAVAGFALCGGAYQAEYIRGAIQSIKHGQMQAALSLGLTKPWAVLHVILPQALRRAMPGIANEFTYLVKYSSLAFMITVIELTGAGKIIAGRYFVYTYVFSFIAAIYLVLVSAVSQLEKYLAKRFQIPGVEMRS
ncbi:MAG TPA: amino acid ABC transporter permease [Sediminispirochaeta sp.]|nr:amino acid ABC transporter permease [Sediminispirochaeta sp.]